MNLILLPGNSPANKPWIEHLSRALAGVYPQRYIQYYRHWDAEQGDESVINFQFELEKLLATVAALSEFSIVAKSAGVLLALKGINENNLAPKKCVFLGTPIPWGRMLKLSLTPWFQGVKVPTLYVQQTADPAMLAKDLEKYLRNAHVQNCRVKEIPGNNHEYEDVDSIAELIKQFL